jgi:hypothetical protein
MYIPWQADPFIEPSTVVHSGSFRVCVSWFFGTWTCSSDRQIIHCSAGCSALPELLKGGCPGALRADCSALLDPSDLKKRFIVVRTLQLQALRSHTKTYCVLCILLRLATRGRASNAAGGVAGPLRQQISQSVGESVNPSVTQQVMRQSVRSVSQQVIILKHTPYACLGKAGTNTKVKTQYVVSLRLYQHSFERSKTRATL